MKQQLTPHEALRRLIQGNERYHAGLLSVVSISSVLNRKELAEKGQNPFAVILACSDSRVPAELLFDQGLGDIFVVRVAGNVTAPSLLASIEFAATVLETPLCVVMGHTGCGAIKAAIDYVEGKSSPESKNLTDLLERIAPAVRKSRERKGESLGAFQLECLKENVQQTCHQILQESPILQSKIDEGKLALVGALYDIESGLVDFEISGPLAEKMTL